VTRRPQSAAVLLRQKLTAQIDPAELAQFEQQAAPNGKPSARSMLALGGVFTALTTAAIAAKKQAEQATRKGGR